MTDTPIFRPSDRPIVYVRPVDASELPAEMRQHLPPVPQLYAIHAEQGERMAVVTDRTLAFIMARQNEYEPVSVH